MIDAPRILDLRETTNHPISLRYSEIFSAALLTGFFSHGRSQPGVCLAENAPFVETAKVGLAYGLSKEGALEKMRQLLPPTRLNGSVYPKIPNLQSFPLGVLYSHGAPEQ